MAFTRRRHRGVIFIGGPQREASPSQRREEAIGAARAAGLAFQITDGPAPSPFPDGQVVGVWGGLTEEERRELRGEAGASWRARKGGAALQGPDVRPRKGRG
jgi:hypothetical protein